MQYTLQKGGNVTYVPNFLSEELTKQLWEELYPNDISKITIDFKTKSGDIIPVETNYGVSKGGVKWMQVPSDAYDKIFLYPRFTTSMFSKDADVKVYNNSDTVEISSKDWTRCMKYLKDIIEQTFNEKITYAVFQMYEDTSSYLGYHSDRELGPNDKIYSVSLGARRRFGFRQKYNEDGSVKTSGQPELEFFLENGSLVIFDYYSGNKNYKHSLLKGLKSEGHTCMDKNSNDCKSKSEWCGCTRINITFRTFY